MSDYPAPPAGFTVDDTSSGIPAPPDGFTVDTQSTDTPPPPVGFTVDAPPPPTRGLFGETIAGIKRGGLQLVDMGGQIARAVDPAGGIDVVRNIGLGLSKYAKDRALQPDVAESSYVADHPVLGNIPKAAEMVIPSVGIPLAIAGGTAVAGVSAPVAAAAGIVGSGAAFGLSQFQDTKERGLEKGLTPEQATTAGIKTGITEGGLEALSNVIPATKIMKLGKPLAGQVVKSVFKAPTIKAAAAHLINDAGHIMTGEVSTEMAQAYIEGSVEKNAGIRPDADPWQEAKDVIGPTIALSLMVGGAVGGANKLSKIATQRALQNPNVGADVRRQAADHVHGALLEEERAGNIPAGSAENWKTHTDDAIANKAPLTLSDELIRPKELKVAAEVSPEAAANNITTQLAEGVSPSDAIDNHNAEVADVVAGTKEAQNTAIDTIAQETLAKEHPELAPAAGPSDQSLVDAFSLPVDQTAIPTWDTLRPEQTVTLFKTSIDNVWTTDQTKIDPSAQVATLEVPADQLSRRAARGSSADKFVILPSALPRIYTAEQSAGLQTQADTGKVTVPKSGPLPWMQAWATDHGFEITKEGSTPTPGGSDVTRDWVIKPTKEAANAIATRNGDQEVRSEPAPAQVGPAEEGAYRNEPEVAPSPGAQAGLGDSVQRTEAETVAPPPAEDVHTPPATGKYRQYVVSAAEDGSPEVIALERSDGKVGFVNPKGDVLATASPDSRGRLSVDIEPGINTTEIQTYINDYRKAVVGGSAAEFTPSKGYKNVASQFGEDLTEVQKTPPTIPTTEGVREVLSKFGRGDNLNVSLIPNKGDYALAHEIAQAFGKQVYTIDDSKEPRLAGVNAFVARAYPSATFISSTAKKPVLTLLGHELTHTLRIDAPRLYQELQDHVLKVADPTGYKAYLKDLQSRAETYKNLSLDALHEEYVGNVVANQFTRQTFWQEMGKANPSLMARVLGYVRVLVEKAMEVAGRRRNSDAAATLKDIAQLNVTTAKIFAQYAQMYERGEFSADISAQVAAANPVAFSAQTREFTTKQIDDNTWTVIRPNGQPTGLYKSDSAAAVAAEARNRFNADRQGLNQLDIKFSAEEAGADTDAQKAKASAMWAEKGTASPFFQKWFGNSKVVDAEGKPLTVYHGTRADFSEFKNGIFEGPIFFSTDPEFAGTFAGPTKVLDEAVPNAMRTGQPSVMPAYVKINNLFDYKNVKDVQKIVDGLPKDTYPAELKTRMRENMLNGDWKTLEMLDVRDAIKNAGFDGMVVTEALNDRPTVKNFAVFDPSQIKSAIGNNGEFSATNPDIRFSEDVASFKNSARNVTDWLNGLPIKRMLADATTAAYRWIMPVDKVVTLAASQADYGPIQANLERFLAQRRELAGYKQSTMIDGHHAIDRIGKAFPTTADQSKLTNLVWKATTYQLHGDPTLHNDWTEESWKKAGLEESTGKSLAAATAEVHELYAQLTPEQRVAHQAMLDQVSQLYLEGRTARLKYLENGYGDLVGEADKFIQSGETEVPEHLQDVVPLVRAINEQYPMLKGDYMPLMRFGENVVRTYQVDENGELGNRVRTEFFTSKDDAQNYINKINSDPENGLHAKVEVKPDMRRDVINIPLSLIDKFKAAAEARGFSGEALNSMVEDLAGLRANMLPRTSTTPGKLHREGIEGYSQDVVKVFATYVRNHAIANASLVHGSKIEQTFHDMRNNIDAYDSNPAQPSDPNAVQNMYKLMNNLYALEKAGNQEKVNEFTKAVNKATFVWFLASPSVWAVQWSQPFITTIPKMAARHGFGTAFAEYTRAAKEYMTGKFSDEKIDTFDRTHEYVGQKVYDLIDQSRDASPADKARIDKEIMAIYNSFTNPDEQKLLVLKVLSHQGSLDLSSSHSIQDLAAGTSNGEQFVDKLVDKAGFFMQKSETGSRRAAAVSAFKLGLSEGKGFIHANDYTSGIIDDTLFNFDSQNRGPAWRGNTGRIIGQFQFFRFHLVGKLIQLTKDAVGGEFNRAIATGNEQVIAQAKQRKAEARKELAYVVGSSFAMAGAAGTPVALLLGNTVSSALWSALSFLFGDPDDPWDPQRDFENAVQESLGDTAGNVVLKGLPSLVGADISRRVGLGGMADIVQGDPPAGATGTAKANWYAGRILGPTWGIVSDAMRASDALANGDLGKAIQYSSPKGVKDLVKLSTVSSDGVQAGGKTILPPKEIGPWDYVLMLSGVNPMDIALAQEESRYLKGISTTLSQRRSTLVQNMAKAVVDSDFDAQESAREAINHWSATQPKLRITSEELARGIKHIRDGAAGRLSKQDQLIKSEYGRGGE